MAHNRNMAQGKKKSAEDLKGEVESVLFASAKWVTASELQKLCNADEPQIQRALKELAKEYDEKGSSIALVEEDQAFKFVVRDKYLPIVENVVSETELPKSILETLAVIAFKHPIYQSEIVKIRSNKAYEHLTELENRGFIKRERSGRTKRIYLTQKFFDYFDLPPNKVKEAFASYEAVSQEIEKKEMELSNLQQELEENENQHKTEHMGVLEIYDVKDRPQKASVERYKDSEQLDGLTVVQMLDEEMDKKDEQADEGESKQSDDEEQPFGEEDDSQGNGEDSGELRDEEIDDQAQENDVDEGQEMAEEATGSDEEDDSDEPLDNENQDNMDDDTVEDDSLSEEEDDAEKKEESDTAPEDADQEKSSPFDPFASSDESDEDEGQEEAQDTSMSGEDDKAAGQDDEVTGLSAQSEEETEKQYFDEDSAKDVFEKEEELHNDDPFYEKTHDFSSEDESTKEEQEIAQKLAKKVNSIFSGESEDSGEDARDKQFDEMSKDLEKSKEELDR